MNSKAKVYLLAHTVPYQTKDASLNPERVIAAAGKLCYSKSDIKTIFDGLDDEKATYFVEMLSGFSHQSPFEHISFTFGIEGISRACSHQIVRHRIASYSQQSQRYVDLKDTFQYIVPEAIRSNEKAKEIYSKMMESEFEGYREIADALTEEYTKGVTDKTKITALRKKALEDARFALPNACETKIIMTMNARSLLNFFNERCCNRAQWEIRDVANQMLDLVLEVSPHVFEHAGAPCVFGTCPEGAKTCGVKQQPREKQLSLVKQV